MNLSSGSPVVPASVRGTRGLAAPRPAALLRAHRHSFVHVLVLGGHPGERRAIALKFHREGPVRTGEFLAVNCAREAEGVERSLRCWLSALEQDPGENPLRACARGTLLLDRIERLPPGAQRLLGEFVRAAGDGHLPEWGGRLTVGAGYELLGAVAAGRFSRSLFDSLDKVRIELHERVREKAS